MSTDYLGLPDIRRIGDAYLDDASRTAALLLWLDALDGWAEWPEARRVDWVNIVALRTIREILPIALDAVGLPNHAKACRKAADLDSARAAADSARFATSDSDPYYQAAGVASAYAYQAAYFIDEVASVAAGVASAYAVNAAYFTDEVAAAAAACYAAKSAAKSDHNRVLDLAVQIQIDAAKEVNDGR